MYAAPASRSRAEPQLRAAPARHGAENRRPAPGWHRIATALPVSRPGDASELEAESKADALMRGESVGPVGRAPSAPLQRACAACEEEQDARIDRSAAGPAASSATAAALPAGLGAGAPLSTGARGYFEPLLGIPLADVRVHHGAGADQAAGALNAHAFTLGRDIAFAAGRYQPESAQGRRLLAHELVHVAQQAQQGGRALQRSAVEGSSTPGGEAPAAVPGPAAVTHPTAAGAKPESCPPPPGMDCQPAVDEPATVGFTIRFAQDSARLDTTGIADTDAAAAGWHSAGASGDLRIDGFASAEGECGYNWLLSCRRAQAVAHELEHPTDRRPGVPAGNLELLAHGESDSAGSGLAPNRRATISVPPPAPTPPAPPTCALPVLLGTGRTGCGSGTDFTHNDHPSISAGSTAKLAAWAAAHTGGFPFRSMVSDAACELEMGGVLGGTAGSAGLAAFTQFAGGSGATVTHGAGSTLGALALASPQFATTVATVRSDIETQLAAQAASGTLDPCTLSVVPPGTSWRFSFIPALEAVIGGTHGEKLFADAFSGSASARTYSIVLRFVICDNFGVDEHDLYAPGLFPFWVLQHERGSAAYAPFINELELPVAVTGTF